MIRQIINFSLKHRLFILLATLLAGVSGIIAYQHLPIDVFPDPSPPLVQVFTEAEGMAPEEVERLISYPIETAMFGIPKVKNIRSVSTFALSVVNIYFEDRTDIYWARQLVSQRLHKVRSSLPAQTEEPMLGPIATGLGLVYLYYLEGNGYSPMELRTLQDWLVKYELKSIPNVSQVLSIGGDVKQYQILVNPQLLLKYDLTLTDVMTAVKKNNQNTGASFITRGKEEYIVRSLGLIQTLRDLENIVLTSLSGTPVYLKDVARIKVLPAIKRGTALANGEGEKVAGMILKLFGTNTAKVIKDIEERIALINNSLPLGVKIVPFYNQASFIKKCFTTVSSNLGLGIILVIAVLFLFMGRFSTALIAVLSLPFSILFSFILMNRFNLSADLMSFGGLAIGIGLIADASIILTENIQRHLHSSKETKSQAILSAGSEVGRPLFFAIFIIIVVFLPIFTLTGMEGIMFRPMGYAISFALAGSLFFALMAAPALASYFIPQRKNKATKEPFLIRHIKKIFLTFFSRCQKNSRIVFIVTLILFISGISLIPFMGREYIPSLNEGTLHLRATLDPNISLEETITVATAIEKKLREVPEISGVLTRIGRGEVGSHAHFVNDAEILIQLKPRKHRNRFKSQDKLIEDIEDRLDIFPGLNLNMTQPIAHNLDELLTGVKAQLAVKIYGENFDILKDKAAQIKDILGDIRGAEDLQIEQFTGQNHIQIRINRDLIARHGMNIRDIQDTIQAALGGVVLGQVFEEQRRFDIFLRFLPGYRNDINQMENLLIPLKEGGQIPLQSLAVIEEVVGPRVINREDNKRYITIQCNVRGRDMGSFVSEAKQKIEQKVSLPAGYLIKWGGQFELQQSANRRLALIMPVTLIIVIFLLFSIFYSFQEVLIILINIPLALTGGLIALKLSGLYLSVPASIGFIAIFGIALEDGLVLLSSFHDRLSRGLPLESAVFQGISLKLRPVLMTTFTTIFGILPLLLAQGPGAEVQRPLATVVVGSLVTSTLVTLIVLPLVYSAIKKKGYLSFNKDLSKE
ncbi:MAG: efflux RND transporter permease subunit [Acidobacteriota bacterium]